MTAVDRALVERIAREVIRRIESGLAPAPPSSAPARPPISSAGGEIPPATPPSRVLVLVTGAPGGIDEAVRQIEALGDLELVVAACAAESVGPEVARRVRAGRVVREGGSPVDPAALAAGASALVVPLPTTTVAGKAAHLIHDSLAPALIGAALLRGIPVYLAPDSLPSSLPAPSPAGIGGHLPPAFDAAAREHVERLARLGVRVVPLRELAAAVREGRAGAPTAAPAPTVGAAGGVCAPSATVACGDLEERVLTELGDDPEALQCAAAVSQAIEHAMRAGACRISCVPAEASKHAEIAKYIDHTLLRPDAKPDDVRKLCDEAKRYCFASVCVNPGHVSLAKRLLRGSGVKVCCVVGFPLGATTTMAKAMETRDAVADGADEIDMVINIGWLKAGEHEKVKCDIEAVVQAARGRIVKVIFETHLLTDEEKVAACRLSKEAGAHFVKTSTGFSGGGATVEDIALMRRTVGPLMGVKASGGVRDVEAAKAMIEAGANRIGTSSGIAIVTGQKPEKKGY